MQDAFRFLDNGRIGELVNCFVACVCVFIADNLHYLKLNLNRIEISVGFLEKTIGQKKYGDSQSTAAI